MWGVAQGGEPTCSADPLLSETVEDQMGRDSVVKSRTGGCGPFKSATGGGVLRRKS